MLFFFSHFLSRALYGFANGETLWKKLCTLMATHVLIHDFLEITQKLSKRAFKLTINGSKK